MVFIFVLSLFDLVVLKPLYYVDSFVLLKCLDDVLCTKFSHITARMTSAYASVCSYTRIHSQTLIYVRGTLGKRRVRSKYADIRR